MAEKKTEEANKTSAKKTATKKPVEREVIKVSDSGTEKKTVQARPNGNPVGLRIGAFISWLIGIGFEVVAILTLNGTFFFGDKSVFYKLFGDNTTMAVIIGALVLDMIAVIIGSQLWKKANHIDPASERNKLKFFLQNQLGVIVAVIAFVPMIILLLKNKDLDAKTRKIVTAVAAVALVIAGLFSVDFNPVSKEQVEELEAEATASGEYTGVAYWTQFGKSYHFDQDCQTIKNSKTVYEGTLEQAIAANRTDPCDFCAGGADQK